MQFIKPDININFVGRRKFAFVFSLVLILLLVWSLVFWSGGRVLARKVPGYPTVAGRFDIGLAAQIGTQTIDNDDPDEDPFVINLSGAGQTAFEAWATGGESFRARWDAR